MMFSIALTVVVTHPPGLLLTVTVSELETLVLLE